ncbi:alpha-glucosidase [Microbacteriaceae bacterium MWH-Ta3]|nr:alpha-glucosidase [Microbacteriaceae bacterium MWH-Ta3]
MTTPTTPHNDEWWRSAVIYQVYPRSFGDANGDGIGDLPGITARMEQIARLGVDAVWLSPFYKSSHKDGGYDVSDFCDVDPIHGTLADFDALAAEVKRVGLKLIVDIVPNHSSTEHVWFQEALAAGPGSAERARYIFRDGKGDNGELPPNNWLSVFGGPAWTRVIGPDGAPEQWYMNIFDSSQPDFDWTNEWVQEQFDDILRFWLDRGVDGFRVDVAAGLAKKAGLPDWTDGVDDPADHPFFGDPGSHEYWRRWRAITDSYPGERILCAEAGVDPLSKLALWVRPDEMHQAFNFPYAGVKWDPKGIRAIIDESLEAFGSVGAPSTWVQSNHDQVRHTTRLAMNDDETRTGDLSGLGPRSTNVPDLALSIRRGRASTALMLGLPGSAYLYQGEELGLPEVHEIPDSFRQDPTFFRTAGERYGRDGCRVPIPWKADAPAYGFNTTGESWLPQPSVFRELAYDQQDGVSGSTLEMYRAALRLRHEHNLGHGSLTWIDGLPDHIVGYENNGVRSYTNYGTEPFEIPAGRVILDSGYGIHATAADSHDSAEYGDGILLPDETVWVV